MGETVNIWQYGIDPLLCRLGGDIPTVSDLANRTAAYVFGRDWIDNGNELKKGQNKLVVDAKSKSKY